MASLIDNLITTLNTENDEYAALLDLSMEKTGIIVKGDVDALNNIVEREQEVIERIIVLEKKREECTKDIATVLNKDYRRLTLPLLIEYLKGQEREARLLSEVHGRLKSPLLRNYCPHTHCLNNWQLKVPVSFLLKCSSRTLPYQEIPVTEPYSVHLSVPSETLCS